MEQRSPEWFAARKGRLTASSIGAVMGLNPYRGPEDVLRAMVRDQHGAESEFTGNVATEYGTFHEEGAAFEYTLETGIEVDPGEGFYKHGDFLGASPDGLVNDGLIEIKCPYGLRNKEAPVRFKTVGEQPHYYAQMQMQMHIAEKEYCHFYQWAPNGTRLDMVEYNAEFYLGEILPAIILFEINLRQALADPDEYLEPLRKEINTKHAAKLVAEYEELQEAIDRATERKKDILDEMVRMSAGRNALIDGHKLTQVERKGSVSYAKAIKEHLPKLDLEPYRGKASTSWKFT